MEKFDYTIRTDRIDNYQNIEDITDSLLCIICQSIPLHPLQCRGCEVICCSECYEQWQKPGKCPQNCKSPGYKAPSKITMKFFSKLKVECKYRENRCQQIVPFDSLDNHEKECGFQKKKCPEYKHCYHEVLLKDLPLHAKGCVYIKVECEHCKEPIPRRSIKEHIQKECPSIIEACSTCALQVLRRELAIHEKQCEEAKVQCKSCKKTFKKMELSSHLCIEYVNSLINGLKEENQQAKQENLKMKKEFDLNLEQNEKRTKLLADEVKRLNGEISRLKNESSKMTEFILENVMSEQAKEKFAQLKKELPQLKISQNPRLLEEEFKEAKPEKMHHAKDAQIQNIVFKKMLRGHTRAVSAVVQLRNGLIITASSDKTIKVWDLDSRLEDAIRTYNGHEDAIFGLIEYKNGKIASGSKDSTIRIWSNNTCELVLRNPSPVYLIAELSSGRIAAPSGDGQIRIWNPQNQTIELTLTGHSKRVWEVLQLPDGSLVSSSDDKTLRIWDSISGVCNAVLRGHTSEVKGICLLEDGSLASGGADNTIRVWNLEHQSCKRVISVHSATVYKIKQISSSHIISTSFDKKIKITNIKTGFCEKTFEEHTAAVCGLDLLQDGGFISSSDDKSVRVCY